MPPGQGKGPAGRRRTRALPRLRLSTGRACAVSFLSGALLCLAYPEADLWPLAWIALAPFLAVCARRPAGAAALVGGAFGIGFFGALLTWISIVGWIAWAVLVLLQALFIVAFAVVWGRLSRGPWLLTRVAGAGALWVLIEIARASVPVVGFSWGELAQSQHDVAQALDPAAWGGRHAVAFIIVAFNALGAEAILRPRLRVAIAASLLAVVTWTIPASASPGRPLRVAIVQGNVPREWTGTAAMKDILITTSHARLSIEAAAEDPDLVVWPESSVGLDPERVGEVGGLLQEAARSVGVPMIVGGNTERDDGKYQVMAFLLSPDGRIVDRYQKVHLVPFGEYVPSREALDFIPMLDQVPRDAVPGRQPVLFPAAGGVVAPVISFEGDFGSLVRDRIGRGGELLVVATNTSTWEESWASAQHLAMSQVRSAENRVWTVHAALSGISGFIRPDGSVVASLPLWQAGTATEEVAFVDKPSFYARHGDGPVLVLAWALVLMSLLSLSLREPRIGSPDA